MWAEWLRAVGLALARVAAGRPAVAGCKPKETAASARVPVAPLRPLEKLILTDGVSRSLFEGYAEHRRTDQGENETGWLLMGHREAGTAFGLATLPAGILSEAGVAHVRFNSVAQAVAGRILRMHDRRLTILGVVHTHPGSLRRPSHGDYRGDIEWVKCLRGREGVFGIGTSPAQGRDNGGVMAAQPSPSSQCYLGARFDWYALGYADRSYRSLPVEVRLGPDLASCLHRIWPTLEHHGPALEELCCRLVGLSLDVQVRPKREILVAGLKLGDKEELKLVLCGSSAEYYMQRSGELLAIDLNEPNVARGTYLVLAELAGNAPPLST